MSGFGSSPAFAEMSISTSSMPFIVILSGRTSNVSVTFGMFRNLSTSHISAESFSEASRRFALISSAIRFT